MTNKELLEKLKNELHDIWMEEAPKSEKDDVVSTLKHLDEYAMYQGRNMLAKDLYMEICNAELED